MGMYDFAAGDKLLNDKLTVLAVSLGPSPLAPSLAPAHRAGASWLRDAGKPMRGSPPARAFCRTVVL
eukprot:COSAG04_NODE_27110_length_286_cov_1.358289_1_plen_66_part_10